MAEEGDEAPAEEESSPVENEAGEEAHREEGSVAGAGGEAEAGEERVVDEMEHA